MAQGVANVVVPFFGGIPATGTIARTVTNVRAGARTPIAGIVHAFTLLTVMLAAAPLAAHVPLAALAGILLVVAWNMGEWREFAHLRHLGAAHRVVMLGTFTLTVVFDLTVAVQVGLAMACGFFIYRMGTLFRVEIDASDTPPTGVAVRRLYGSLFFGAATRLESLTESLPAGTHTLVLQAHRLISIDTSGLDALRQLHRVLARAGVKLVLCELNDEPLTLIRDSGFAATLGSDAIAPTLDSAYRLAAKG
jgi:sulfate permease, SulP family